MRMLVHVPLASDADTVPAPRLVYLYVTGGALVCTSELIVEACGRCNGMT